MNKKYKYLFFSTIILSTFILNPITNAVETSSGVEKSEGLNKKNNNEKKDGGEKHTNNNSEKNEDKKYISDKLKKHEDDKKMKQKLSEQTNWKWVDRGNYIELTEYIGNNKEIVIPNEVNGKPVEINLEQGIKCSSIDSKDITSITFSNDHNRKIKALGSKIRFDYWNIESFDGRGLDISGISDLSEAFRCCSKLSSINLNDWDFSNVVSLKSMFDTCTNLQNVTCNNWKTTTRVNTMAQMFWSCQNLVSIDLTGLNTSKVTDMTDMFMNCFYISKILGIENWDVSNVQSMRTLFFKCYRLQNTNFNNWDVSNVKDMSYMFLGANSITDLDLSNWNVSKVENMEHMFDCCINLKYININNWDVSNVKNMDHMFYYCQKLPKIDLSNWNVSKVENIYCMFAHCDKLRLVRADNWKLSNVQSSNIKYIFDTWRGTPLVVITNAEQLLNYNYSNDGRIISGPKFDANGGKFEDGKTTKMYFDSCAIKPNDSRLNLSNFEKIKNNLIVQKKGNIFSEWKLTEGQAPTTDEELFNPSTYTAQWGKSLIDGNIPYPDFNQKTDSSSLYGIAYSPIKFTIPKTALKGTNKLIVPIENNNGEYHVGVRDQRSNNGNSNWTLQTSLIWDKNDLTDVYIQTENKQGVVNKNINDGSHKFSDSDLIPGNDTVLGNSNVKISKDNSVLMASKNSKNNGVYDYNLGKISLVIPHPNQIKAGTYSGSIQWTLVNAPQ